MSGKADKDKTNVNEPGTAYRAGKVKVFTSFEDAAEYEMDAALAQSPAKPAGYM